MKRSLLGIRLIVEIIHISLVNSILKDGIVLPNSKILSIARTKLILQTDGMIFIEFIIETQITILMISWDWMNISMEISIRYIKNLQGA